MRCIVLLALLTIGIPALGFAQVPKTETKKEPLGKTDVEQAIIKLDKELMDAFLKKDKTVGDRIEVADHVFVNPGGGVEIRSQQTGDGPTLDSLSTSDITVRAYGDTAILTGLADLKGRLSSGADITGQYRYMRVFVKQKGEWKLVATTATQIRPAPTPPKS